MGVKALPWSESMLTTIREEPQLVSSYERGCDSHRVLCHLSASNDSAHVVGIGLEHVHQMPKRIFTAAARPPPDNVGEGLVPDPGSIFEPGCQFESCQSEPTLDLILSLLDDNACKAALSTAKSAKRGQRPSQGETCMRYTNQQICSRLTPLPITNSVQPSQIRSVVSPVCNAIVQKRPSLQRNA